MVHKTAFETSCLPSVIPYGSWSIANSRVVIIVCSGIVCNILSIVDIPNHGTTFLSSIRYSSWVMCSFSFGLQVQIISSSSHKWHNNLPSLFFPPHIIPCTKLVKGKPGTSVQRDPVGYFFSKPCVVLQKKRRRRCRINTTSSSSTGRVGFSSRTWRSSCCRRRCCCRCCCHWLITTSRISTDSRYE